MRFFVGVYLGEIAPKLVPSTGEKQFYTQWTDGLYEQVSHVNPQSAIHGVKVGVWCAMSATTVNGYSSFCETVHSHRCYTHRDTTLHPPIYDRTYASFPKRQSNN